jgi:hypothetical protein
MSELLVPMNLEALVVGLSDAGAQWVNLKPDFRGVYRRDQVLGQQLGSPLEFSPSTSGLKPGVHLHWALPDGLTHGVAPKNGGSPEFPAIPNRWLVVRFWDQNGADQPLALKAKAWIVESDSVATDPNAAIWPTFGSENLKKAEDYSVLVGKQFELSRWPGENAGAHVAITAVGYGDAAFAAYYPACKGILGFHDQDLSDVMAGANLNYLVAGWYADPAMDPLQRALSTQKPEQLFGAFDEFLGAIKWTYPGFADAQEKVKRMKASADELQEAREMMARLQAAGTKIDGAAAIAELQRQIGDMEAQAKKLGGEIAAIKSQIPSRTVCHGILTGVQTRANVDSGVPRGKPFRVSLGDTAVEALAALFETACGADLGKLLAIFQYDLLSELEKPGGGTAVDRQIHERCYRPLARGKRWDLLQEARPAFGSSPEDRAPPIPGDVRLRLEQLNRPQRRINQLKRERDLRKSELYAAWYKKVLNTQAKKLPEGILNQRLEDCRLEIERLTGEIAPLEDNGNQRPKGSEWGQLQESLDAFLPGWKIQQFDEPQFWRPNDPVALLAGESFQRSPRHGEDGRFRADGQLLCRLGGQEISGIKITIPFAKVRDVQFGPADIDRWCDSATIFGNRPIPSVIVNLFREALLLTLQPKQAADVVTSAYEKNEPGLAASHAQDIQQISRQLIDTYLKKVWETARDPKNESPALRFPEPEVAGQTIWELIGRLPSPVVLSPWEKNPWLPLFLQWQVRWVPAYSDIEKVFGDWRFDTVDFAWQGDDQGKQPQAPVVYRGTALLTPSATLHFSDRLRQYNLAHGDAKLTSLQTAVASMNVLCQSLGGFTDQLMMRKGYLELRPLDPGTGNNGPQFSAIFDAVKDIDWLSPMMDGKFLPLRSGYLTLEKLWVIDAFGQFLKLEEEDPRSGLTVVLPERLAGPNGAARLPPRLVQPARVALQWLRADRWDGESASAAGAPTDEEFNPICGWILPNLLDKGLMIYDARGYALGSLQANQRKSWRDGVGGVKEPVASFHWVDLPGSENFFFGSPPAQMDDPLGAAANPHLRAYVRGLLSLTEGRGQAFAALLESMSDALAAGAGSSDNPNLALLVGKPLALVRAAIWLEVDGGIASAQGWDAQANQTGGIERVKFPLRLGDRRRWKDRWLGDDGLMGFFISRDYRKFYPACGLQGRNDSYNTYGFLPQVSLGEKLDVTLIMDPARGLCVASGILPRAMFHLPDGNAAETLENKEIIFFSGPVVGPDSDKEMRMPQPSDVYGQWSWTHHPDVKVWSEKNIADTQKEWGQFSETPLSITEGWLKLIAAPLTIRAFTVMGKNPIEAEKKAETPGEAAVPARFEVERGKTIVLSWSVVGAEEIELKDGESSLFKSHRHPLPARFAVAAQRDTSFTLTAVGRAERSSAVPKPAPVRAQRTINVTVKKL